MIAVQTAPQLYNTPGVVASFAALLRNIGYAGGMPPALFLKPAPTHEINGTLGIKKVMTMGGRI